jgi:hypothetical protein
MDRVCIATLFPNGQNVINLKNGGRKEETGTETQ